MRPASHTPHLAHLVPDTDVYGGPGAGPRVVGDLEVLLARAGVLDLDDPAWTELAADARNVTRHLAEAGRLDAALVVAADDPPVRVARLLVRAWLRVSGRLR